MTHDPEDPNAPPTPGPDSIVRRAPGGVFWAGKPEVPDPAPPAPLPPTRPYPNRTAARRRTAAQVADDIAARTNNGELMIDVLIELARMTADSAAMKRVKMDAARELWNRMIGKPLAQVIVAGHEAGAEEASMASKMTDAQLAAVLSAAGVNLPGLEDEGEVLDADFTEDD